VAAVLLGALAAAFIALRPDDDEDAGGSGVPVTASSQADVDLGALDDNPPVVGQPAPNFILRSGDGGTVRLSDLRGKVVFVNFWATWCKPCKEELPDIDALYDEKRDDGLEVIAVNVEEDLATAERFFRQNEIDVPMALDTSGEVYRQYRLQGLPDSFFVDREGNLAAVHYGFMTDEKMRDRLETAGLP